MHHNCKWAGAQQNLLNDIRLEKTKISLHTRKASLIFTSLLDTIQVAKDLRLSGQRRLIRMYVLYLYVFLYVCILVCMYTCVCILLVVCVLIVVCILVCLYVYSHVCMYVYLYVCMYTLMYVCIYTCMFVCILVCIHTYMCMHRQAKIY